MNTVLREEAGYWPDENEFGDPFNPNLAKPGDKIRPIYGDDGLIANGYPIEMLYVNTYIKNQVYTILTLDIHPFTTGVILEEIPDKIFNSVHFKLAKDGKSVH